MQFDGWCASRNVDPIALPPSRLCNLIEHWLRKNLSEEGVKTLDRVLAERDNRDDRKGFSRSEEMALFESG